MTKFDKLNIYTLSVSMAASPLVSIGTGPTAIALIRLIASVLLVLSVSLRILTFIICYRKLWSFASYSPFNFLWLVYSVYLPTRDIFSTHYEITEIFTALNFSLVPLSTILLARYCIFNDIISEKKIFQFILPSMIVLPVLLLPSLTYLAYSWASLAFLFVPPVYFLLCLNGITNHSTCVKLRSYILIASTLLCLWIVANYAIAYASRTLSISSIYCITILCLSLFFSGKLDKAMTLLLSPVLISIYVFYVSSSNLFASFNSKNVAAQSVVTSSYDFGPVSSILNFLGLGDNRSFVWFDLFSRKISTLLFGDPGATLFSVIYDGYERDGVEGFFANLIMDYGLISTSLLCFFLALVLAMSVLSLHRTKLARNRPKISESIDNLYIGWFPILVLVPLVMQAFTFYNPSSSLAFVYMFSCISFSLLRRSWKLAR